MQPVRIRHSHTCTDAQPAAWEASCCLRILPNRIQAKTSRNDVNIGMPRPVNDEQERRRKHWDRRVLI